MAGAGTPDRPVVSLGTICKAFGEDEVLEGEVISHHRTGGFGQGEVLVTIKALAAGGMTSSPVTREVGLPREVANDITFTDRGVMVEHGPPAGFVGKVRDPGPRQFLSQIL